MTVRLVVYSHNYWPEPTGIPYYNTGMCRWFAQRLGWDVTVRTGLPHYPWWRVPEAYAQRDYRRGGGDETVDGVRVERVRHFVPTPPLSGLSRMRLDLSWLAATAARSFTTRRRPDVIVLIAPPFLIGLLGWWLRFRFRAPVVYHVQDLQVDAAVELKMLPQALSGMMLVLERFILRRVDLVTTISPAMRDRLARKARTRRPVALFPNWVDTAAIAPWLGANRFRIGWDLPAGTVVALYSGNVGRKQGLEVLIHAARLLPPHIVIIIAGEGAERRDLEDLARREGVTNVRFQGLVDAEGLAEFLSAADLHCVIQRHAVAGAVMPSKLLNIMAVARPVVVTALPGTDLAMAVANADCGIVVAPEDPTALAGAIVTLAADPQRCQRSGAAGRAEVERELGADRVLARFAARLRRLTGQQS